MPQPPNARKAPDLGELGFPVTPPAVCAEPTLDLEWTDLSSRHLWDSLADLEGVETAQHLLLTNARNADGHTLRRLADYCPQTRVLDLRACPQLRSEHLEALSSFRHLTAVKLGNNNQLDDTAVDGLLACGSLVFLELVNATGLGGPAIARLACLSELQSLLLGGCDGVSDDCVRRLSELTELRDLRLVRCPIGDRALSELGRCRKLRHLNLNGCDRLSDGAAEAVSKCNDLEELRMSGCHSLSDGAWPHLVEMASLRALSLSGAAGLSDGIAVALGSFSNLQELRTRACSGLGDRTAGALSGCRQLRLLDAAGWKCLTSGGVAFIARLPELRECGLSDLDDAGLGALGGGATNLRVLALRACTQVTGEGIGKLASLIQLRKLLLVEGSPASSRVLEALRGLPALREVVVEGRLGSDSPSEGGLTAEDKSPGFSFRVVERAARISAIVPERLTIAAN